MSVWCRGYLFLFGAYVFRMNRALFFGAMMGARTCTPAMEIT
ncbi:hypothetical protein ACNKHV_04940 [Shigella flexneri]